MKKVIIALLLVATISGILFGLKPLLGLDLGLTARHASATEQLSSTGHTSSDNGSLFQDGLSSIPLAVDMSVQSVDAGSLLSMELITLVVVALGLMTAAAIVWDDQQLQE